MLVFIRKITRIHIKMGEIHELLVLALSLVWFAGATPDSRKWTFPERRLFEKTPFPDACKSSKMMRHLSFCVRIFLHSKYGYLLSTHQCACGHYTTQ